MIVIKIIKKDFLFKLLMLAVFTLISTDFVEAKRNFTFDDAMKFESLRFPRISNNAKWFAYEAKQDRGDITASINSTEDTTTFRFANGRNITFSNSSEWVSMIIYPTQMENENAKSSKDKPNNSLKLVNLNTKREWNYEDLVKFSFSEDSKWLVFTTKNDESTKPKIDKFKDKKIGSNMVLHHLNSGTDITINWVTEYLIDTNSRYIFYIISEPKGKTDGIYYRDLTREFAPEVLITCKEHTHFSNLAWNKTNNILAFLTSTLNDKGKPNDCSLMLWKYTTNTTNNNNFNNDLITVIADSLAPKNWYLPSQNLLKWNDSDSLLYLGLKPINEKNEEKEPIKFKEGSFFDKDTLLAKAEVHVWHWDDPLIITQQQSRWKKYTKDKIYYAVYNLASDKYVQLADTLVPDIVISKNNNFTIGYSDFLYRKEQTWYGDCEDIYSINLRTGEKNKIVDKIEENASITKNGNYIIYYKDKNWYLYDTKLLKSSSITGDINNSFYDLFQDVPSNINSCGFGGWVDDDKGFFLYDNWDIWYFETANLANYKILTKGEGKSNNIKFTLRKIDLEADYFTQNDTLLIHAFNKKNKDAGYYYAILANGEFNNILPMSSQFLRHITKVKNENKIIFAREQYDVFPNYWLTDYKFNTPKRISHLNLAIKDTFNWGTTELFEWNYQDTTLQGYLIKPDNYNPKKKYPVFVYFYDQMSSRMNMFYMPEMTHRPINQVYMDNYIMFFPDITYGVGSPGQDALQCILSGCRALATTGIIDTTKSCIQGHSWGGYQTAYIVTQTDFFSAACAGAPVGNMTSAYSGIRLESGRTRQFQYEAQQSRIGGNLWDSLDAYIRNSPVFFANKTKTPFLIGFGDIDEAVPWQQGIELYMSMRRAQAPAIMLQYVNEPHWQGRYWNKLDYSVRMKEFFDHYVLGVPAPSWITNGQAYKGEDFK